MDNQETYELPSRDAYTDGPVVHHFEQPGTRASRPDMRYQRPFPIDSVKSMPLDWAYLATDGGGADGTAGYVALEAYDALEFYAESAPIWWVPGRLFDLRDTWTTFYFKEIEPITVADGWRPHLFAGARVPSLRHTQRLSAWYLKEPLTTGNGEWTYNEVLLSNDQSKWINYTQNPPEQTLDMTLGQCGFIGWMYMKGNAFRGANATGVIGWDEFRFNLREHDMQRLRAGLALENVLEV